MGDDLVHARCARESGHHEFSREAHIVQGFNSVELVRY